MRIKNIFIPLAVGVILFAISSMLGGWEYDYLVTYLNPRLVVFDTFTKNEVIYKLSNSHYTTLIIFAVVTILSQVDLKRREII